MKKSSHGGVCKYRGPDGLMCAAGCLIGDDEYQSNWEDLTWYQVMMSARSVDHADLIRELQLIHDHDQVKHWPNVLHVFAKQHNLNPDVLSSTSQ